MPPLTYQTAGESHGQTLIILVEGMPAGVKIDTDLIDRELKRRQGGYGRGGRMKIERDHINVLTGIRNGTAIGAPMALQVPNNDFRINEAPEVNRPRPGHADLAGSLKWLTTDCRETLERASARETTSRVAAGALSRSLLKVFGVEVVGFVSELGSVKASVDEWATADDLRQTRDANDVYCPDPNAVDPMIELIRKAKVQKDTLGGIVEVRVFNVPPGLGSCFRWQDRLDGRLMQAVGSIQAFKGAEIGMGFDAGRRFGSEVHDAIYYDAQQRDTTNFGFTRKSNRAGGLEGGITDGQTVVVRGVMKPISTLLQGMDSVNLKTLQPERSDYERSDVCALPAASVVAENVVAFEIAKAWLEKFGGDTLKEVRAAYDFYCDQVRRLPEQG